MPPTPVLDGATSDDAPTAGERILRLGAVLRRTGLGRSTIYRMIAAQRFPAPVRLTGRAVGWRQTDLERWSASLRSTSG